MQPIVVPLVAVFSQYAFGVLMFLTSTFLVLLVLVQRGRGGGLAGAFGGMGGQSAFGTKAGDLFTRITMVAAGFWILLCILAIAVMSRPTSILGGSAGPGSTLDAPVEPVEKGQEKTGLPPAAGGGLGSDLPSAGKAAAPVTTPPADAKSGGSEP